MVEGDTILTDFWPRNPDPSCSCKEDWRGAVRHLAGRFLVGKSGLRGRFLGGKSKLKGSPEEERKWQ